MTSRYDVDRVIKAPIVRPSHYSGAVIDKVSDADFHNVMKDISYSTAPRDVITVGDMETAHYIRERNERGAKYYG